MMAAKTNKKKPNFAAAQLAAGGLVAVKAKADDNACELVVARRYTGAPLGDRVVVRLGGDRLGPAEDLAMEFLGLTRTAQTKPIAKQSRRALGFADWALVTHPENAKYALGLVKRIKAAARKAKSKPGHAWDMFDAMAAELNRSVKEFLPPFWEEAARIYRDLGSPTYAGRSLNRALEAERVHALPVDRDRRRDAVLEFALAGCLSGKALSEYAKDVQKQYEPAEALQTIRDLTVRRTMGGLPPVAGAAKDLLRLAKANGEDADATIDALLTDIISASAMQRAPLQFWKSIKKQIGRRVARDPSFAIWLLVQTAPPNGYYWNRPSPIWEWIDLLEDWGVLQWLSKPSSQWPKDVELPGGRAAWMAMIAGVESVVPPKVFDLLESAASQIIADGAPIRIGDRTGRGGTVDVDFVEACLDLGVPVRWPKAGLDYEFSGWLKKVSDHPRRNSSLRHVLAESQSAPEVKAKIGTLIGTDQTIGNRFRTSTEDKLRTFAAAAADHETIAGVWWERVDHELSNLESGGMVDVQVALEFFRSADPRTTAQRFPEFETRLRKIDLADALRRTLVAGVFDEYGWKALDDADDQANIPAIGRRENRLHAVFPTMTLHRDDVIEVIRPDGAKRYASFPAGKGISVYAMIPTDDDVLIRYSDNSKGYYALNVWLSDLSEVHETSDYGWSFRPEAVLAIDGGIFCGSRIIQPGDTKVPDARTWFADGDRIWVRKERSHHWYVDDVDEESDSPMLSEIDPATGKLGRDSVPPFFESTMPVRGLTVWEASSLMPLPRGRTTSPLGHHGGLIGWHAVTKRDGSCEGIGIDGRRCELHPIPFTGSEPRVPLGMMDKPATDDHWIITDETCLTDAKSGIMFAHFDERKTQYRFGQPANLTPPFFHLMSVRCERSSKLLRQTTTKTAKNLIEAGRIEHEARKLKEDKNHPDANRHATTTAVQDWLGDAPARLIKGIGRIARLAAVENISLTKLVERIDTVEQAVSLKTAANNSETAALGLVSPDDRQSALAGMKRLISGWPSNVGPQRHTRYYSHGSDSLTIEHLDAVNRFFNGESVESLPRADAYWATILLQTPSKVWSAAWAELLSQVTIGQTLDHPLASPLCDGLDCLQRQGWFDLPDQLTINFGSMPEVFKSWAGFDYRQMRKACRPFCLVENDCRHVIYPSSDENSWCVITRHDVGKCKPPSKFMVDRTTTVTPGWTGSQVTQFVAAFREIRSLPTIAPERFVDAAEQLGVSPAQVALAWWGDYRTARYGQEKLTKELRDFYGWKVTDIKTAVAASEATPRPASVTSEACRPDPAGCLTDHLDAAFDRFVDAWARHAETMVSLPPETLERLKHVRRGYHSSVTPALMQILSDPANADVLRPRKCLLGLEHVNQRVGDIMLCRFDPPFSIEPREWLEPLADALQLVNYALPFGHPARRVLPDAIDAVIAWLDHPDTSIKFGTGRTEKGFSEDLDVDAVIERLRGSFGKLEKTSEGIWTIDGDGFFGGTIPPSIELRCRTAKLTKSTHLDRLVAAATLTHDYDGNGADRMDGPLAVLAMRDPGMQSIAAENRSKDLPGKVDSETEAWDQDPRRSVPNLIDQVAKRLKVDEDAAVLYLQVLSLPDPTSKNISLWNGWKPTRIKNAARILVDGEHLVNAKRSRAQRDFFLPGGWEALKAPNLPIESWKLPSLGFRDVDPLRGSYARLITVPRTVSQQFTQSWKRVLDGDVPMYQEAGE